MHLHDSASVLHIFHQLSMISRLLKVSQLTQHHSPLPPTQPSMDAQLLRIRGVGSRLKSQDVAQLSSLVRRSDLAGLQGKLEALQVMHPGMWGARDGVQVLRRLASRAAELGHRDVVLYLWSDMGVPLHCAPDEGIVYSTRKQREMDSLLSPLFGALSHEDLALELLALLPRGDACLSRTTAVTNLDLLRVAMQKGATRVASELLSRHKVVIDNHASKGHTALCVAAENGDSRTMSLLLGQYLSQGRLEKALTRPCNPSGRCKNCVPYPLLYHVKNESMAEVLLTWWQATIPVSKDVTFGRPVHRAAAACNLPLLRFYVEKCGLGADDPGDGNCVRPLSYACADPDSTDAQLLPVVQFLLDKGADPRTKGCKCRPPWKIALECGKPGVHDLLRKHASDMTSKEIRDDVLRLTPAKLAHVKDLLVEANKCREEVVKKAALDHALFEAKEREAEEAMQALLADEESQHGRSKKPKKKKKGGRQDKDKEACDKHRQMEAGEDGPERVAIEQDGLIEDDAPDAYVCPIGLCILDVDPVVASDGFVYSRAALETWIRQCETKGLPLRSPKTGEVMEAAFLASHTHRALVKEWVAAWQVAHAKQET